MFVRLARFEGVDLDAFEDQVALFRRQIAAGRARSGASMGEFDDEAAAELEQVPADIRIGARRLLVAVNARERKATILVFCDTERELEAVDAAVNALPLPEGAGRRASVEFYEVRLDEDMRPPLAAEGFA